MWDGDTAQVAVMWSFRIPEELVYYRPVDRSL